jgi:hypothetical protein
MLTLFGPVTVTVAATLCAFATTAVKSKIDHTGFVVMVGQ